MPRNTWPTNDNEYDHVHKVVLVGDAGVGKTSLVHRFTEDIHSGTHAPTIGVDFKIRKLSLDGRVVKLHLWDTTGNERFRSITTAYYRAAHGIAICFDVTSESSFDNVAAWLEAVEQFGSNGVVAMLVGTKSDLQGHRQVARERAERMAASRGLTYVETSSLCDQNVQLAFESMTHEMAKRQAELASHRRSIIRAGGAPLRSAIANWRPVADGGCCSCLAFLSMLTSGRAPSPAQWEPIAGGVAPALASVASAASVVSAASTVSAAS